MLIFDLRMIGNRLYEIRTKKLLSRAEVAERAAISDRTYADIERGSVTMRIDSLQKICNAMNITPNDILVDANDNKVDMQSIIEIIKQCSENERQTALKLLKIYTDSLK